jgi:hypothetical protein
MQLDARTNGPEHSGQQFVEPRTMERWSVVARGVWDGFQLFLTGFGGVTATSLRSLFGNITE